MGYLPSAPLIRIDFVTDIHSLTVYEKEGLSFAWKYSYLCFHQTPIHLRLTSFFSMNHCPLLCARFLMLYL